MATLDQTTNSIAVDGNVLLVNTNTNRVGINQSTPSVALHVVGSTTIDSGNLTLSTGDLVITSGAGTIAGQAILKSTDPISLLTNDAGYVTTNTTYSAAAGGGIGLSGTAFSLDIDGMNATSNTPTNDDLLIMDDGANGTNRKITFTQTADWISDNVYRFHIEDLRDEGDISPNNFDDRAMTLLFTDDITGSPNSWDSVITMKGWSANYRVWQLWSSASSGSQSVDQVRLYFRSGEEDVQAGWGQTKEILTFPGTVPVTDGSNGQVMQTNGSGVLSWATISGGGVSIGDAVGSGTSGSILFVDASTNLAQDNGELYWDNTNNRLGIGTTSPSAAIEVNAGAASEYAILSTGANGRVGLTNQYGGIHFNNVEATADLWQLSERDTAHFDMSFGTPDSGNNVPATDTKLRITSGGSVGIGLGNTNPSTELHVNGTIRQAKSTNAVLVSDGNGDIGSASNLQDVAYLDPNQFQPPVNPPPAGLPDSPPAAQVQAVGWIEFDIGMGPMFLPVYQ